MTGGEAVAPEAGDKPRFMSELITYFKGNNGKESKRSTKCFICVIGKE